MRLTTTQATSRRASASGQKHVPTNLAARKLGDAAFPETVRFIQDSEVGLNRKKDMDIKNLISWYISTCVNSICKNCK